MYLQVFFFFLLLLCFWVLLEVLLTSWTLLKGNWKTGTAIDATVVTRNRISVTSKSLTYRPASRCQIRLDSLKEMSEANIYSIRRSSGVRGVRHWSVYGSLSAVN